MTKLTRHKYVCLFLTLLIFLSCAPAALALPYLPARVLKTGDLGLHVTNLQNGLQELGLFNERADGVYGEDTAAAVRQLQRMLGVNADGEFNQETIDQYAAAQVNDNQSISILTADITSIEEEAAAALKNVLNGKVIGIDPGHQLNADLSLEPISPGSSRTKEKMSVGAVGAKTGIYEYETNLQIAKKLKKLLADAGATVIMTRTKNDVSLSNIDRAKLMNDANVDCWVRVHCDFSSERDKSGISVLTPSTSGNSAISGNSAKLAKATLNALCDETGASKRSVVETAEQTGFNWSNAPVITAELGFLSNPTEDVRLNRDAYQKSCAAGLFGGLAEYFLSLE